MNSLKDIIRKNAKFILISIGFFLIVSVIVFIANMKVISTLFSPLSTIKSVEDANSLLNNNKVYAQLENSDVYLLDYGVYTYKTRYGVKTSNEKLSEVYGLANFEDGYVLLSLPASFANMKESELDAVTAICKVRALDDGEFYQKAYEELISEVAEANNFKPEEIEQYVPKLCLEVDESGRIVDQLLFALNVFCILLFLILFILEAIVMADYKKSKLYRQLSWLGNAEDVEYTINQNLERGNYLYKSSYKSIRYFGLIMPNYTIAKSAQDFKIFITDDLIWAHLNVTTHKVNFIPVSKSYRVKLFFRGIKKPVEMNFKTEQEALALVKAISENLPVICGYSKDLENSYNRDYANFLQNADQYRVDFYHQKAQEQEEEPNQA